MLKKCAFYIGGFISTYSLLIILAILIVVYVWHAPIANYISQKIEASRKGGSVFYLTGIWDNAKGIQQMTDNRSNRALELAGNTKNIADKSKIFSFDVPETWVVRHSEGILGNQLAKIVVESPGFTERRTGEDIYYDNGAQLTVQLIKGEQASTKLSDGGYGASVLRKVDDQFGTQNFTYFVIKDNSVQSGDIIVANVIRSGNTYNLKYIFNAKTFNGGEFSFQEILHSFKFNDKR